MRPEILFPLFKTIDDIKGVGPKTKKWLQLLCNGDKVIDLLFHLPVSIKQRLLYSEQNLLTDNPIIFPAQILTYHIPARKRQPLKILVETDFGEVELVYFNYHLSSFTQKFPEGSKVFVSGVMTQNDGKYTIVHPDFLTFEKEKIPKFEPIYPMIQNIKSGAFSRIIHSILGNIPDLPEWIDDEIIKEKNWPAWKQAFLSLHFPNNSDPVNFNKAKERLAYDELLSGQLALKIIRQCNQKKQGIPCPDLKEINIDLPFQLTKGQEKVLNEISIDLSAPYPMNRLLQGDVGSGKTVVALLSALQGIQSGYQVAIMAPTDILARQHYQKIQKLLFNKDIYVGLLTSKEKGQIRKTLLEQVKSGQINLLIGTHALIEETVQFKNLALAIVDEQHRFGVNQRLNLIKKQKGCNLLVMSATPIPRSLAMTHYGDMEISVLDEKPIGRQEIKTCLMGMDKIVSIIEKIKQTSAQAYWVCPLIEESEKSDLAAVQKRYAFLQKYLGDKVALLHGKMKVEEKNKALEDFKNGIVQVLVSTTVVEVGVDVPNATLMIIEQAERFGLATLHQLRGRVGRGQEKAFCFLLQHLHKLQLYFRLELQHQDLQEFQKHVHKYDQDLSNNGFPVL